MPTFDNFYFISSTGVNRIRVKTCTPDGEVRGVVQIAHGIAEHADRYADFMNFLAENGFAVAEPFFFFAISEIYDIISLYQNTEVAL